MMVKRRQVSSGGVSVRWGQSFPKQKFLDTSTRLTRSSFGCPYSAYHHPSPSLTPLLSAHSHAGSTTHHHHQMEKKWRKDPYSFSRTIPLAWEAAWKGELLKTVPRPRLRKVLSAQRETRRSVLSLRAAWSPRGLHLPKQHRLMDGWRALWSYPFYKWLLQGYWPRSTQVIIFHTN